MRRCSKCKQVPKDGRLYKHLDGKMCMECLPSDHPAKRGRRQPSRSFGDGIFSMNPIPAESLMEALDRVMNGDEITSYRREAR